MEYAQKDTANETVPRRSPATTTTIEAAATATEHKHEIEKKYIYIWGESQSK